MSGIAGLRKLMEHHSSPEALLARMWAGIEIEGATFGGQTAEGAEVEVSRDQFLNSLRAQGVWGFSDGERIHFWTDGKRSMRDMISFFAHELAHLHGMDAEPNEAEEERWAEQVARIAVEAWQLAGLWAEDGRQ